MIAAGGTIWGGSRFGSCEVDFVVSVVRPNGVMTEVRRVHELGRVGILRTIDVDLTPYVGATKIRLRRRHRHLRPGLGLLHGTEDRGLTRVGVR